MNKQFPSWQQIDNLTHVLISNIEKSNFQPSVVVGVSRGGLIPAVVISHSLNIPLETLDVSLRDKNQAPVSNTLWQRILGGHKILVVDDINDSGATFEWIKNDWFNQWESLDINIRSVCPIANSIKFGAIYENQASTFRSDFYATSINKQLSPCWIVYPWEKL